MCDSRPSRSGRHLDGRSWDALKAAGFSDDEFHEDQPLGPVIFAYSRRQAIADGVLVDLMADETTRQLIREAGFKLPIAMTAAAFRETVLAGAVETPDGRFSFPAGQDLKGRLWDVLMVLRLAIRTVSCQGKPSSSDGSDEAGTDRVGFQVSVWDGDKPNIVKLWCQCGDGEAVLRKACDRIAAARDTASEQAAARALKDAGFGSYEVGVNLERIDGAILQRRSHPWDVDVWHLCYDLSEMLRHDGREVIYAGTEAEVESEIWKRYPVEGSGVTLITKRGTGWEIERAPRLMHADLNSLQEACAIHRRVLVGNDLVDRLVEYIHGVEDGGDEGWLKLAKWVRSEARAAGVKVPPRKKLPPRPAFGKKAARRRCRRRHRLQPVPA